VKDLYLAAALAAVVFINSIVSASTSLTDVSVNTVGSWQPLEIGEQVFHNANNPGNIYRWSELPSLLTNSDLTFWQTAADPNHTTSVDYGLTSFRVNSAGVVWMITTDRFSNSGNSSGDWLDDVSYQADLEQDGWSLLYTGLRDARQDGAGHSYLVFGKNFAAPEDVVLRTEKYIAPIVLQGTVVPSPTAATGILAIFGLVFATSRRTRSVV